MGEALRRVRHAWPWMLTCLVLLAGLGVAVQRWGGGNSSDRERARIVTALMSKRWEESESRLAAWVRTRPNDGEAWCQLGDVRAVRGREEDALDAYGHVPESNPAWLHARVESGEIRLRRHELAEAESAFRDAARADPRAVKPRRRLVFLLLLEQREAEARSAVWELFRLTRDVGALVALTGLVGMPHPEVGESAAELDPYFQKTPDDSWLVRARGLIASRRGRQAEARPFLEAAAKAIQDDAEGRLALAECQVAAQKLDDVEDTLGTLPPDPPDQARWWLIRSDLAAAKGRQDAALADLGRAVAADPENPTAHFRLGQALSRRGDATSAALQMKHAEVINARVTELATTMKEVLNGRRDAETFARVGNLCRAQGLHAVERAWFEETIRLDPTRSDAQMALAQADGQARPSVFPRRIASTVRVTVAAAAPSLDAEGPSFEEVADRAGLRFRYESGASGNLFIADTMGGGVALLDYDGDGRLDVYLIGGCKLPVDSRTPATPNKLFRNLGDGLFQDVTEAAGVSGRGYGMGAAVGDYDSDGHDDLFVTGFGETILYHNRGDGTFEDVTRRAGVGSDRWTTAAGFGDLDGDGDLDLVVVTYVAADPRHLPDCRDPTGHAIHCPPSQFPAESDHLFRNNGDGTFTDVAREAGFDLPKGPGLGLAIADLDGDRRLDVFVANDATPNFLFRNLGGLKFAEVGVASGVAYDRSGHATASMGVVAADLDGDGRIDLFHTNFLDEGSTFLHNLGGGLFVDATAASGLDAPSRPLTGFGAVAFDADNDGRIDLFTANGHVDDRPWLNQPMAQFPQFFRSKTDGAFTLATGVGPYFERPHVGRGVAAGDFDNDGRVDLVVIHRDEPAALLHNTTAASGHWLGVRLVGGASGRTPIGAKVTCHAGGRTTVRWLTSGTSYLASQDQRLWFGLGASRIVDRIEVEWPAGNTQSRSDLAADRIVEFRESDR